MEKNIQVLWQSWLNFIKDNIADDHRYNTWFNPIKLVSYEDNTLTIEVPSNYFYEFLEEHYLDLMSKGIYKVYGQSTQLEYRIKTDSTNNIDVKVPSTPPTPIVSRPIENGNKAPKTTDAILNDLDPRLNPNYRFNNFIEGDSNHLSRVVGMAVAEKPAKTAFNPLFVFGPSGVGKTHLVNAIGAQIKERYPQMRVLYVSAHLFMVQYTDSIRNNHFNDFINFYQSIDVLIIDDIQELSGVTKTQNAFFHIFNHLKQNGKQLIMTSDRTPAQMQGFEDRLLTRFKWGMLVELEKPSESLRKAIMKMKITHDGLNIPEDVINFIASNVSESVRDLEGIINSLMAYSVVYNCDIDMDLAEKVIGRVVKFEKKSITIEEILEKSCEAFNVTVEDVSTRSRKRPIVMARQMAMYLAQKHTDLATTRIGVMVGNRDHATVLHSIKQMRELIETDKTISQLAENLESELKG